MMLVARLWDIILVAAFSVIMLVALASAPVSAQAANSMYVTPGSGTFAAGNGFTVEVRVNTTEQVNAVGVELSYDAGLQFVSIDAAGSAFGIDASGSGGNGSVSISRATTTPVSGDQLIAKVTFKGLSAGSNSVQILSGSQALSASTYNDVLTARNGGNYMITTPATLAPPAPVPTASTPSTPSSSSTTSSPTTKSGPVSTAKAASLPRTTVAPQGSSSAAPLPGDSVIELRAPATVETAPEAGSEVVKVEYLLNGKVVTTDTTAPYSHSIQIDDLRNGSYTLTTKTYYKDGKVDTSNASLVVKNPFGLKQFWLQFKHYAWLIVILLIIAGELIYLKFFRNRAKFSRGRGDGSPHPTNSGHGQVVVWHS